MNAADLRHRISIRRRSTAEDTLGQEVRSWVEIASVRAKVENLKGNELLIANAERAENIYRVTIRYIPNIVEKMQIIYDSMPLDITNVSDVTGRKRELEIMCKAGLTDG